MTVRQIQRLLAHYPFPDDDPAESAEEPRDATSDDSDADGGDEQDEAADDGSPTAADAAAPTSGSPGRAPETVDEFCSMLWNDDGTFRIHVAADADTGLIIERAMREAPRSALPQWPSGRDVARCPARNRTWFPRCRDRPGQATPIHDQPVPRQRRHDL